MVEAPSRLVRGLEAAGAGFEVEHVQERPEEPQLWGRLYGLWVAHEADLRRELGDAQAEMMLGEGPGCCPDSTNAVRSS
ncbi:hypothetical protein OHT93_37580 [Streptomyces sp. NBC_00191]|uniref:hypothetical protein n=1 Tax=Streptomyces sp. NBC_00191 TaxID=2975674 RepID=UPI0032565794